MTFGRRPHARLTPRGELWVLVVILIGAAFLRFHAAEGVPPGPSHDELRMMELGEMIVQGERPLHWKISYSAEPLFMYLLALAMPVWGFTPFGARLVTRFVGMLLIPVAHRFIRGLLGRREALFTSGVLAVTWWPLFFSRVALRGITLPLVFTGGVICLWKGLGLFESHMEKVEKPVRWGWLAGSGTLLGLSWYTFTAARGMILLLPMVFAHVGLLGVIPTRRLWRVALVTLTLALVVAAPFAYEMHVRPGAPESRLDQLGGVIDEMVSGDVVLLGGQVASAVGVFGIRGDPNWRYNIAGRPPFGPLLGAFSILGILLGLSRWRQPRYALLVIWLALGLAPSMLTPEAPSFVRGIGALPVVAVFPAVGAVALWDWVTLRGGPKAGKLAALLLSLLIVLNGFVTFRDAFTLWPNQPEVREIYQASLTEAFREINHSNLEGTLWISEPFPDDRHVMLAERMLRREPVELRWFDGDRALILPPSDGARRVLLPDFTEFDEGLMDRWMDGATVIMEDCSSSSHAPAYRLYEAVGGPWVEQEVLRIMRRSEASLDLIGDEPVVLPARFEDIAQLLGYELADDQLRPGDDLHLTVYWRVPGPVYEPVASFAHLIDERQSIVGQYDGFDVPPWHWEPEAIVAQVYRFTVEPGTPPGTYWLQVGLYDPQTMERVQVAGVEGSPLGSRLVLTSLRLGE